MKKKKTEEKRMNFIWKHIIGKEHTVNGYYKYLPLSSTTFSKFFALVASFTVIVCHLIKPCICTCLLV